MKTVVTGAPGWLGSRLLEVLLDGYDGKGPSGPARELVCLVHPLEAERLRARHGSRVLVLAADLTNPEMVRGALDGADSVLHCAGAVHVARVPHWYALHSQATRNVLDEAVRARVRRFVLVSSSTVGGFRRKHEPQVMTEADAPRPYMNYGRSKLLAEQSVLEATRRGEIEGVALRPCWFYGPNQPERQTRWFRMIRSGRPIVFGDGGNLRSMSYIDNVVQGVLLAEASAKAPGQIYWIADERPYSTNEIYETVAKLLDVRGFAPRRVPALASDLCYLVDSTLQAAGFYIKEFHVAGELQRTIVCSIDKARRELGYAPVVGLEEGMRRSIAWCRRAGLDV